MFPYVRIVLRHSVSMCTCYNKCVTNKERQYADLIAVQRAIVVTCVGDETYIITVLLFYIL